MTTKKFLSSMVAFSCMYSIVFSTDTTQEPALCEKAPNPMRASIRHIEPNGIGYNQGYTSFDVFLSPTNLDGDFVPFLDARAHVFDNGKPACNAGLGLRYINDIFVYGINAYYDYRNTNHYHYNQVGAGLEFMFKRFDLRWNGYLPVGAKSSSLYDTSFSGFKDSYAYVKSKKEFVMKGMNLEGGCHFYKDKNTDCYFAIGPYYFEKYAKNAIGGQVRLSATFLSMIKIDANASYDPVFKGVGQGQIGLVFPLGKKVQVKQRKNLDCKNSQYVFDRSFQSVDRFEIIVADKKHEETALVNPVTNKPFTFSFIQSKRFTPDIPISDMTYNSSSLSAAGLTYPTPPPTPKELKADVIVIEGREGVQLSQGLVLNNQMLMSDTTPFDIPTTHFGVVNIPARRNGKAPFIYTDSTYTGPVVTLKGKSLIAGLGIYSRGNSSAISSQTPKAEIAILKNNLIGSYTTTPISIQNPKLAIISGNKIIAGQDSAATALISVVSSTGSASDVRINRNKLSFVNTASSVKAIYVNASSSSRMDLKIDDNSIFGSANQSLYGIEVQSQDTSKIAATVTKNTINLTSLGNHNVYGILEQTSNNDTNNGKIISRINQNHIQVTSLGSPSGIEIKGTSTGAVSGMMKKNFIVSNSTGTSANTARAVYLNLQGATSNWEIRENLLTAGGSAISEGILVSAVPAAGIINGKYNVGVIENLVQVQSSLAYSSSVTGGAYGIDFTASGPATLTTIISANGVRSQSLSPTSGTPANVFGIQVQVSDAQPTFTANINRNNLDISSATPSSSDAAYGIEALGINNTPTPNFTGSINNNSGTVFGAAQNKPITLLHVETSQFPESGNTINNLQ